MNYKTLVYWSSSRPILAYDRLQATHILQVYVM